MSPTIEEKDPHGKDQHEPGAKLDAGKPMMSLILLGFPRALEAVAMVGTYGADKYSRDGWRQVPDGFYRYTDAMGRHLAKEGIGEFNDPKMGLPHAAAVAWNALARLELLLTEAERADSDLIKGKFV